MSTVSGFGVKPYSHTTLGLDANAPAIGPFPAASCSGCGLSCSAPLVLQGQASGFNAFETLLTVVPLAAYGIFSLYRAKVNPKAKLGAPLPSPSSPPRLASPSSLRAVSVM